MSVYLIADIDVTDPAGYEEYKRRVPALIAAHGGRYIARGGTSEVLEGTWHPKRTAIIEFPSLAAFKTFWNAPDYQPLRELRERSATSNLVVIEGLSSPTIPAP
jgi:uncharacterized protein (DUF1330 family)